MQKLKACHAEISKALMRSAPMEILASDWIFGVEDIDFSLTIMELKSKKGNTSTNAFDFGPSSSTFLNFSP